MNVLLTNFCNRSCPYCFAKGKLIFEKPLSSHYIKSKDFNTIVAFLKRSRQKWMGLLGGEPTLHPEFKKIVTTLIKERFDFILFTNGMMPKDTALFLGGLAAVKHNIILNINTPASYSKKEWSVINRTLQLLGNKKLILGFTIYRSDFKMDFIVDLIERYQLNQEIRVGIAVPIFGFGNKYLKIADYQKVAARLLDFLEKNRPRGIRLGFDCGFIRCGFTEGQLRKFSRYGSAPVYRCGELIDVGPDLNLWRCFATSGIWNKKLSDFKNLHSAVDFYRNKFSGLRRVGATAGCFHCEHLKLGRCSGGCLGYTLREFKFKKSLAQPA